MVTDSATIDESSLEFQTRLEQFQGPLDLLLYLIKQNEVEIEDLPIVKITDQFLEEVEKLKVFDPEKASRFLVLASTLVEIKSVALLPREEIDLSEIEDPRNHLIQQLLAYREFKEKAKTLGEHNQLRNQYFTRGRFWDMSLDEEPSFELGEIEIWDLLTAFQNILEETLSKEISTTLSYDEISIEDHMHQISNLLLNEESKSYNFKNLVQKLAEDKVQLVGLFVALLELTRLKYIRVEQPRDFSDIYIVGSSTLDENMDLAEVSSPQEPTEPSALAMDPENSENQETTFELDKVSEKNQALKIDSFYKSQYRLHDKPDDDKKPDESADTPAPEQEDFSSQDVDPEVLAIIQKRIPETIFNPSEEDLKNWREKQDPETSEPNLSENT